MIRLVTLLAVFTLLPIHALHAQYGAAACRKRPHCRWNVPQWKCICKTAHHRRPHVRERPPSHISKAHQAITALLGGTTFGSGILSVRRRLRSRGAPSAPSHFKTIVFNGRQTIFDSIYTSQHFKHNNSESMLYLFQSVKQQGFYFFHKNQLWKVLYCQAASGLLFTQFLGKLIQLMGKATPVFKKDSSGVTRVHHVEWSGKGELRMWALDYPKQQSFCMAIFDSKRAARVLRTRNNR